MKNKWIDVSLVIVILCLGFVLGSNFGTPEIVIFKEPIVPDVITEEGIIIYKDLDDAADIDQVVVMDSRIEEIMDTKGMHIIFLKDLINDSL